MIPSNDLQDKAAKNAEKLAFARIAGKRLHDFRIQKGISQETLSEKAGYYRTYVGHIESGRYSPSLHTVWRLAHALGVDLGEMLNGTRINFLGVKYSFWGCISAKLAMQICRLGAEEIVYVGKLGTLSSPDDIYCRVFAPSKFLIMYHDKIVCDIQDMKNNLLTFIPICRLTTMYPYSANAFCLGLHQKAV